MHLALRLFASCFALGFLVVAQAAPPAEEANATAATLRNMRGSLRTLSVTPRDLTDQETKEFRTLIAQTRTHLGALIEAYAARETDDAQLAAFVRLGFRLTQLAAKSTIRSDDCATLREIEQQLRAAREEAERKRT